MSELDKTREMSPEEILRVQRAEKRGTLTLDERSRNPVRVNEEGDLVIYLHHPEFQNEFLEDLGRVAHSIVQMLLDKNRKYGDSALSPRAVLAKNVTPSMIIRSRMDEKIKRMESAQPDEDEDPLTDFIGYYFLLRVADAREHRES